MSEPEHLDVHTCIIGAGVSGLCVANRLAARKAGAGGTGAASFVIIDAAPGIGGTWLQAAGYPGAACDVPSHLYSLSFALNAGWSRKFAPASEIREYLEREAAAAGITSRVRCGMRMTSAVWSAADGRWTVRAEPSGAGELVGGVAAGGAPPPVGPLVVCSRFLVSAVGALCVPQLPAFPGVGTFTGPRLHTARWRDDVPLAGRRVAVVGTGASAAQVVPALAKIAKSITVFQRTPSWLVPRRDWPTPAWLRFLFWLCPPLLWLYHMALFCLLDVNYFAIIEPLPMLPCLRPLAVWLARRHLRAQVPDASLRERLTPRYEMGCKRVLLSDDFYPALSQPHVSLITAPIARETTRGLATSDGAEHAADVIVYATGFDVLGSVAALDVRGLRGADLRARLTAGGAESYLGVALADFPNFFVCLGPNTGLGHNSIIAMIECQTRFMLQCMARAETRGSRASLSPRPAVQAASAARLQRSLGSTVWRTCASWYNLQGGKNISMWPGTVTAYWWATLWPRFADFDEANPDDA